MWPQDWNNQLETGQLTTGFTTEAIKNPSPGINPKEISTEGEALQVLS